MSEKEIQDIKQECKDLVDKMDYRNHRAVFSTTKQSVTNIRMLWVHVCEIFWKGRPSDNEQRWQRFELYECFFLVFHCFTSILLCHLDFSLIYVDISNFYKNQTRK